MADTLADILSTDGDGIDRIEYTKFDDVERPSDNSGATTHAVGPAGGSVSHQSVAGPFPEQAAVSSDRTHTARVFRRLCRGALQCNPGHESPRTGAVTVSGSLIREDTLRGYHVKIVVIGGTGLIGSKLVAVLKQRGEEAIAASPATGVNTLSGEGLNEVLRDAQVVVDVANSPSFEDAAVLKFFETSGRTLLAAEAAAGVRHHIALSIVGADRLPDCGYMRAKVAQENLVKRSWIPYTILRSTQFFEFGVPIADAGTEGDRVHVPRALIQPIFSEDVVSELAEIALSAPVNGTLEIGGPERLRFDEFISRALSAKKDKRKVLGDPHARYFGAELEEESLVPARSARIGRTRFDAWSGRLAASG